MPEKPTYEQLQEQVHALQEQIGEDAKRIEKLKESEDRYHRMLENLEEEFIFYRHDTNGNFTYVSPSYRNILGYLPDEYLGKDVASSWTNHYINTEAKRRTLLAMQGLRQPPYEMEIYHKSGTRRRFITIETPILDVHGKVIAVEGTARDITEKRKIEEQLERYRTHLEELVRQRTLELQESKKQLFDIIDFLPYPTYVINRDETVIAWNRAMATLTGIATREVVGKPYHPFLKNLYNPSDPLLIDGVLKAGLSAKDADLETPADNDNSPPSEKREHIFFAERHLEKMHDGKGGYIWITAAPILDNDNRIAGAIESIRDVTEIKQAERKIQQSERRLSTLMSNLPGMAYRIVGTNDRWQVEFVSQGSYQIFGYEPSFFINRDAKELRRIIHPDDLNRVVETVREAIKDRKSIQCEYRILTAQDETKWVFDKAEAEAVVSGSDNTISVEGFMADFTVYKKMEERLKRENTLLRSTIRDRYKFKDIIGNCAAMQEVFELIVNAASSEDNVFISGESGTGKELVAQAIHNASNRRDKRFVAVNCAAIPENLIESEFFGARKGAFSGAHEDKKGYLETADNGTLFLDEIGDISPMVQVKLLRAIDGGGFSAVGSRKLIRPNLRIIAATNKDVKHLLTGGAMRQDFFFRIHVIPIHLPALRERGDDILLLINHFLKQYGSSEDITTLSRDDLETLRNHRWPGNVRELQNVLRRYLALKSLHFMRLEKLDKMDNSDKVDNAMVTNTALSPEIVQQPSGQGLRNMVEYYEKELIQKTLEQSRYNRTKASRMLGVSRKTLFRKMKNLGLE
jgi:PAS domain S-box-containing protein